VETSGKGSAVYLIACARPSPAPSPSNYGIFKGLR
jgi:hypothetical protein